MNKRLALRLCLGMAAASIAALGCQSQARPTPTIAPVPTEGAVVVVVTATPQPTLAVEDTAEPTITPLATLTPISSLSTETPTVTATARKTATTVANTPQATRAATVAATNPPAPTSAPAPSSYRAPIGLTPSLQNKDTETEPAGIPFKFRSVGPLKANECYLVHLDLINPNVNSGAGDDFLDPNSSHCGDQSIPGTVLSFGIEGPKRTNVPNYGTIETEARALSPGNPAKMLTGEWYVVVVQNNGPSGDGVHYKYVPVSPRSAPLQFNFVPTS